MILYDPKNSEESQVRFKINFPDVKLFFASRIEDIFGYTDKDPNLIVMEAEVPKEDKGIILGNKRIRSPFLVIKNLKDYSFVIYTRGTKEKKVEDLKKSFSKLNIEVVHKDIEQNEFLRIFSRYFLDFSKAKIKRF